MDDNFLKLPTAPPPDGQYVGLNQLVSKISLYKTAPPPEKLGPEYAIQFDVPANKKISELRS